MQITTQFPDSHTHNTLEYITVLYSTVQYTFIFFTYN